MSEEPESNGYGPDPLANQFPGRDDTNSGVAPLLPAQPQYTSRREMKEAMASSRRSPSRAPGEPVGQRRTRLSRRDRAAVRRLAATPKIEPVAPTPPRPRQNPFKVLFVLLVICGFVGGIALPAAAYTGSTLSTAIGVTTGYKNSQSVKVSASIESAKVSRDAVGATTEAELRTEQINAQVLANRPGPKQPGDDYPWRDAGYGLSPLAYYYRQCVDFVAWRLNRDAGVTSAPWKWTWSTLTPNGGDASQWKAAWLAHGWPVSNVPVVGSVAWFVGNHVAYVHEVDGPNVVIEEYNGQASRAYAERTIPTSSVAAFLYPPT
ncbi:MAG: CHAP domain-containing protein [Galbitalea sp.]